MNAFLPSKRPQGARAPRRFPLCQAHPGQRAPEWLNQRELGRLFGLSGTQMGQRLVALGWCDKARKMNPDCEKDGRARTIAIAFHRGTGMASQVKHQWSMAVAVPALETHGLTRLDGETVFAQAAADCLFPSMVGSGAPVRGRVQRRRTADVWPMGFDASTWWVERLIQQTNALPPLRQPPFLTAVRAALAQRGVEPADTNAVFERACLWHLAVAAELDKALPEESPGPGRVKTRF